MRNGIRPQKLLTGPAERRFLGTLLAAFFDLTISELVCHHLPRIAVRISCTLPHPLVNREGAGQGPGWSKVKHKVCF